MKCDSRLSSVLHVLLHLAEHDSPSTSEALAAYLDTNPVVVRRVLGGLRDEGIVEAVRGHGGGWSLAQPLDELTLLDIHEAVGAPSLFAIGHRRTHPDCLVEQVVNDAVDDGLQAAERVLTERLAGVTLADLARRIRRNRRARPGRRAIHVS